MLDDDECKCESCRNEKSIGVNPDIKLELERLKIEDLRKRAHAVAAIMGGLFREAVSSGLMLEFNGYPRGSGQSNISVKIFKSL